MLVLCWVCFIVVMVVGLFVVCVNLLYFGCNSLPFGWAFVVVCYLLVSLLLDMCFCTCYLFD